MATSPTINAIAPDGRGLIDNAYSTFHLWSRDEIYFGPDSPETAIYIPKKRDLMVDLDEGKLYEFTAINPVTYIPTYKRFNLSINQEQDVNGLLIGVGPGAQNEIFRLGINKNTLPYSANIDRRCWVGGSDVSYARVYRGSPVMGTPMEVISLMYDTNTQLILGNDIPLENVSAPGFVNCKVARSFYTKVDLQENEIVTLIYYNSEHTPVTRWSLLVENSAFIQDSTQALKSITSIHLESPFISPADPTLINYPLNLPTNALNLFGVVVYSNGEQARLPVNGSKFSMNGLSDFVATYPNQTDEWVLTYRLDPGEAMQGVTVGEDYYKSDPYRVRVTQVQGMYSVKLYCFPVWQGGSFGYNLKWFMYDLDRQEFKDVTSLVELGSNTPAFNGQLYGANQQIQWTLKMDKVDPKYGRWVHTQVMNISLHRQGTENVLPRWTVRDQGQSRAYGESLDCKVKFIDQNVRTLNFGSGLTTKAEWLKNAYYDLNPLYDSQIETEDKRVVPDYFVIRTSAGDSMEVSVEDWNKDITVYFTVNPNTTIYTHFIKRTADNDLQLAVGGWSVRQIN